jgi:hypothetical protein
MCMCGPCFGCFVRVDVELPEEYQEPLSSEPFEQQQENFEEGKYNMNVLSPLNTISYRSLILYAYKDFLATVILYIRPWVAFWLVVLGAALSHIMVLCN